MTIFLQRNSSQNFLFNDIFKNSGLNLNYPQLVAIILNNNTYINSSFETMVRIENESTSKKIAGAVCKLKNRFLC